MSLEREQGNLSGTLRHWWQLWFATSDVLMWRFKIKILWMTDLVLPWIQQPFSPKALSKDAQAKWLSNHYSWERTFAVEFAFTVWMWIMHKPMDYHLDFIWVNECPMLTLLSRVHISIYVLSSSTEIFIWALFLRCTFSRLNYCWQILTHCFLYTLFDT